MADKIQNAYETSKIEIHTDGAMVYFRCVK